MRRCCISKRPIELDAVGSATAILAVLYQHFIHHSEAVGPDCPKRYTRDANTSVQTTGLERTRKSPLRPPGLEIAGSATLAFQVQHLHLGAKEVLAARHPTTGQGN